MSHPEKARPLKPWRVVGGDWRGGRVVAVGGATIDVEIYAEQHMRRTYTIAKALSPVAAVGDACVCRIGNLSPVTALANYVIVEVKPASFCGRVQHTAASPNHGHVNYSLTNESPYWDWRPD
jgi:hypothetical protein